MNSQMSDACKHHHHHLTCISWSAIITGVFVGIGVMFLLNVFSVAIGLSVFPKTESGEASLAVGGYLAAAIGVFAAMFLAGWVAGYLGRSVCPKRHLGVLYGFTTWSFIVIATALLTTSLAHYVIGYISFITNPADLAMEGSQQVAILVPQEKPHFLFHIAANSIVVNVLVLFSLFYISALAACFGGHYGMKTRCRPAGCGCCPV